MTDYNKRLDKILKSLAHQAYLTAHAPGHTKLDGRTYRAAVDEAKQAITSLIKELVTEAKPYRGTVIDKWNKDRVGEVKATNAAMNDWADIYEQNLLKALEGGSEDAK